MSLCLCVFLMPIYNFFLLPINHSIRLPSLKGRSETEHKETSLETSLCLNLSHFDTTMKWWINDCDEDGRRWVIDLDCLLNGKNNAGNSGKENFEKTTKASQRLHVPLEKRWCWTSMTEHRSLTEKVLKTTLFSCSWKCLFKHFAFPLKAQQLPDDFFQAVGAVAMATLCLEWPPQDVLAIGAQVFDLQFSSQDLLCKPRLV